MWKMTERDWMWTVGSLGLALMVAAIAWWGGAYVATESAERGGTAKTILVSANVAAAVLLVLGVLAYGISCAWWMSLASRAARAASDPQKGDERKPDARDSSLVNAR